MPGHRLQQHTNDEMFTTGISLSTLSRLRQVACLAKYLCFFRKVRSATMIAAYDYAVNLLLAKSVFSTPGLHSGAVVECGTWRGGMSAGLMKVGGLGRPYLFCDSFAGLPPPEEIDGPDALAWARDTTGARYFNNCRASVGEFVQTMRTAGFPEGPYELIRGYYADSLPPLPVPPVSVLRLDCDWYASTTQCLEKFWPSVLPGGLVLIDDYYDWAGCRKAVHAFLAAHDRPEAIRRFPGAGFAYILKQGV